MASIRDKLRGSRGFTLLELLVVIAIVSALIALLSVSIGNAKAGAQLSKSISNLRQIYTGFQLYAADNNGEICPGYDEAKLPANPIYVQYIAPYLNYPKIAVGTRQWVFQAPGHEYLSAYGSYRMNYYTSRATATSPIQHFSQFVNPSQWLFLFESGTPTSAGGGHGSSPSDVKFRYNNRGPLLFLDGHTEVRSTSDPADKGFWVGKPSFRVAK
jgi:prepilin-type N-terminal cleavage/methylation domain-containing protein/prepilin-type processing-associated H-X9-DG protein